MPLNSFLTQILPPLFHLTGVCIGLAGLAVYGMVALRQPVPLAPNVKAPFGGVASPDHHHHVARNPSHV